LQTYCAIFTSPSSSEAFEEETEEGPCRKKQKTMSQRKATKRNVATLLRMEGKVTPRTIAYAAVLVRSTNLFVFPVSLKQLQLVFNLTSATQWTEEYNGFNFPAFYNFIVDFFEEASGTQAKRRVEKLLAWWTKYMPLVFHRMEVLMNGYRQVFPHHVATTSNSRKSRTKLAFQHAARESAA